MLQSYNESAVFLAFHPSQVNGASSNGAKLPLTVYESVYEGENAADGGKAMQVDGEEQSLTIRFRELPYFVETGEAEMIGVDSIARSARNAAAVEEPGTTTGAPSGKEGQKLKDSDTTLLSQEDEERKLFSLTTLPPNPQLAKECSFSFTTVIANLNTRLNAIRTLESRISLIKSYLASISTAEGAATTDSTKQATLSHPILRNINSLLAHLSLLTPTEQSAFTSEILAQSNDVHLVALLGKLGQSISSMRELGKRTAVVTHVRRTNVPSRKSQMGMSSSSSRFDDEMYMARD